MPTISGIVKDASGTPCEALVVVKRRDDFSIVDMVVSNASTGAYSITTSDTAPHIVERYVAPVLDADYRLTSLLLPMEDTGLLDVRGHAITKNGAVARSNAVADPFGGSLYSGEFNGSNAYLSSPAHADFDCGTEPFALEGFVRYAGTGNLYPIILGVATSWSSDVVELTCDHSWSVNKLGVNVYNHSTTTPVVTSTSTITYDTWNYFRVLRSGTSLSLQFNSSVEGTATISAGLAFNWGLGGLRVGGGGGNGANSYFNGYLKNIRLTKSKIRSGAVPTANFPTSTIGAPTENAQIYDYVTPM